MNRRIMFLTWVAATTLGAQAVASQATDAGQAAKPQKHVQECQSTLSRVAEIVKETIKSEGLEAIRAEDPTAHPFHDRFRVPERYIREICELKTTPRCPVSGKPYTGLAEKSPKDPTLTVYFVACPDTQRHTAAEGKAGDYRAVITAVYR